MGVKLGLAVAGSVVSAGASLATLVIAARPTALGCPGSVATRGLIDCGAVIGSVYGHIFGLPLGFWGLIWLALYWLVWRRRDWIQSVVAGLAFLGVAYAVGSEMRIGHVCVWCTLDQCALVFLAVLILVSNQGRTGHEQQIRPIGRH